MGSVTPEIVERAIAGDTVALDVLWAAHRGWIAAVALAHAPRSMDLEDIMQDIALNMVRSIHTVQEPDAITGWLREIARNTSVAAGRKATRRRVGLARHTLGLETPSSAEHRTTSSPEQDHAAADDLHLLHELVASLSEDYREPLLLCAVRGMSHKQIAALMGLTPTAVETRIRRARHMLRDLAAQHPAQHNDATCMDNPSNTQGPTPDQPSFNQPGLDRPETDRVIAT